MTEEQLEKQLKTWERGEHLLVANHNLASAAGGVPYREVCQIAMTRSMPHFHALGSVKDAKYRVQVSQSGEVGPGLVTYLTVMHVKKKGCMGTFYAPQVGVMPALELFIAALDRNHSEDLSGLHKDEKVAGELARKRVRARNTADNLNVREWIDTDYFSTECRNWLVGLGEAGTYHHGETELAKNIQIIAPVSSESPV